MMGAMRVWFLMSLLCLPGALHAGAAAAGMGGASVGLPDRTGDVADNPATAATGGVDRGEGLVHLGVGLTRMAFAGRIFNQDPAAGPTVATMTLPEGLDWMLVTPQLGPGRVAAGVWELERFVLAVDEPLDLRLSREPGGPPLSARYLEGTTRVRRDEATTAFGLSWIQATGEGNQQFSAGVAYLNTTARGSVEVSAMNAYDGTVEAVRRAAARVSAGGLGAQAGYFFRPVPDGALGVNLLVAGSRRGRAWAQDDGAGLVTLDGTRPAQVFAGVGGSFQFLPQWLGTMDIKYRGGTERHGVITSEPVFGIRAGMEYMARLERGDLPLRVGLFTRPDPVPAAVAAPDVASVAEMSPVPPFRQDVTGFTLGSGWVRGGLRADLTLVWMLANTHVKTRRADGSLVDSGDTRSAFGAVGSLSLVFGRRGAGALPAD